MDSVEKLQKIIDRISKIPYRGVYLWKYVEYEITSGIIFDYQNQEKNVAFGGLSDNIPDAPTEQIEDTENLLNNLDEKEILFGMIPLRRPYNGKLEHTAMDAYVRIMDLDKYTVIEPNYGGQEDEIVYTQNRVRFYPLGVIGKYGQDAINEDEIANFLVTEYIYPIEQEFNIVFPKQILIRCIFKLGLILKERRAYLSFFGEVIDRVKPKVVCYTHGPDPILCFLREAAQEKGVPTVEIEHGGIIRNLIYPDSLAYSDYYLTHSDLLTKPMLERGIKNVFTVGKPEVYENVHQNIDSNSPIVVSFISSLEKDLFLKALSLAKRLDNQKFLVVFKLHTSEQWSEEEMEEVLQQNSNWQFLDGTVDVRDLYAISDIVVGVRSSGILDALPYSKMKILTIEDKNEKELLVGNLSFFHELDAMGDVIMVKDEEQLYQEVINYKRGECYRDTINHYWPSDSEERFKEFIQIFLEDKRP